MAEDHGHDEHGGGGDDHGKGEHKAHKSHGAPHGGGGHEEHAGAPEWLISFADNVALLMGFFVILLAMNMGPKAKPQGNNSGQGPGGYANEFSEAEMRWIELQFGIGEGFNMRPTVTSKDPKVRKLAEDYTKVQEQRKRNRDVPGDKPNKQAEDKQTTVVSNLTVEFSQNDSALTQMSRSQIVDLVRKELSGKNWIIEVRGHVSPHEVAYARTSLLAAAGHEADDPSGRTGTIGFSAGYDLSYQRARVVAAELVRAGIVERNIRIVACSDMQRAVARSDGAAGTQRSNMRVEIIETKDSVPPDHLSQDPGAQPN